MYISIIVALIIAMMSASHVAYAITNSTSNVNRPLYQQIQDLIENPYFAPDASCMFDTYQLQCIPGDSQECPEGFGGNEDGTCFVDKGGKGCPKGYHSADDDETGQCYPNTEPCYAGSIMYADNKSCGQTEDVCEVDNASLPQSCFVEGRTIVGFPDESCLTNPDNKDCDALEGYGCPKDFTEMRSVNFTTGKCVPLSDWDVMKAERLREVYDPGRCADGYKLETGSYSHEEILLKNRGDDLGYCTKIH